MLILASVNVCCSLTDFLPHPPNWYNFARCPICMRVTLLAVHPNQSIYFCPPNVTTKYCLPFVSQAGDDMWYKTSFGQMKTWVSSVATLTQIRKLGLPSSSFKVRVILQWRGEITTLLQLCFSNIETPQLQTSRISKVKWDIFVGFLKVFPRWFFLSLPLLPPLLCVSLRKLHHRKGVMKFLEEHHATPSEAITHASQPASQPNCFPNMKLFKLGQIVFSVPKISHNRNSIPFLKMKYFLF